MGPARSRGLIQQHAPLSPYHRVARSCCRSWWPRCRRPLEDPSPSASPIQRVAISTLETHIAQNAGTSPRLWALWSDWGGRGGSQTCQPGQGTCAFPADTVRRLQELGVTPVIWWQPTDPANPAQGLYERYERTLAGKHDAYLVEWARAARAAGEATGKPILLRYAHEATGYWFPWSVGRFDNTKENYKSAWRYVWRASSSGRERCPGSVSCGARSSPISGRTRGTSTSSSSASPC